MATTIDYGTQTEEEKKNRNALSQAIQGIQFGAGSDGGKTKVNYNPAQFIADNQGGFAAGVTMVSPDKIRLPDGEIVDIGGDIGANGQGSAWWGSEKDWAEGEAAGLHGGGGSGGGASQNGGGFQVGTPATPYDATRSNALFQTLLERSKQGLNIDAANDANIRQQADPFEAAMVRAERERMADMAESRGQFSNLEGERRLGAEKVGQAAGQFESSLISQEVQARRDEIQNALTSMQGMLSQDQQEALQRELAQLDAQLKRYSIDSGASQFYAGLGLDRDRLTSNDQQFAAELRNRQYEQQMQDAWRREGV